MGADGSGVMSADRYLDRWSELHGGVDPRANRLVRLWLHVAYRCAAPLARAGVGPTALTAVGLALALVALAPAWAGGRWAVLAAALCATSGLVDSLDGAVAVLSARVTARGAVFDAVADRCADAVSVLVLLLLWRAGAPGRWHGGVPTVAVVLALVAMGCAVLHEYIRARAAAARMGGLQALTVGERPTRIIGVVMFSSAVGMLPTRADVWAPAGLGFLGAVGVVGLVQLAASLGRAGAGPASRSD